MDRNLRLRLDLLDSQQFERFFLRFLGSGVSLEVIHHGQAIRRRIVEVTTYAAGTGRKQRGIDLLANTDAGERWVFQCKHVRSWNHSQTVEAIEDARDFRAHHYFLLVARDVRHEVHDEVEKHGDWTLWNLDTICDRFRQLVIPSKQPYCVEFLPQDDLKRFLGLSTAALIPPEKYFERFLDPSQSFRHDWKHVGRTAELDSLKAFATDASAKTLVLVAPGGLGKSRILREFCTQLASLRKDLEVLMLNPHRRDENPEYALAVQSGPQLVIVDDAHRVEQLSPPLLSEIRARPNVKLVLSARPQGMEAIRSRLAEVGMQQLVELELKPWGPTDARVLASQALQSDDRNRVDVLVEYTAESPFLTVVAGDLIRRGKLSSPLDMSAHEFRRAVFRAFEEENLQGVPEPDCLRWRQLLRAFALLAPVADPGNLIRKLARSIRDDSQAFQLEEELSRLRACGLLVEDGFGWRVVPDLLADFLVYDVCFSPEKARPVCLDGIMREFADSSPVMIRNLSEATWINRRDGKDDPQFLAVLLDAEYRRFETSGFLERARILSHWSGFGVFLPAESIEMVKLAFKCTSAPPAPSDSPAGWLMEDYDTHRNVLCHVPALLKPVVIHHPMHRDRALEMLWQLGELSFESEVGGERLRPWGEIADVLKYENRATLDVLKWLAGKIRRLPDLKFVEDPEPVLPTLLTPAFARELERSEWSDKSFSIFRSEIPVETSATVTKAARSILSSVIVQGSWLAALDALSAIVVELGLERRHDDSPSEQQSYFARWRPGRRKALELVEHILRGHDHVVVRCAVLRELRFRVKFEEDPEFRPELERVLGGIKMDPELRIACALVSQGFDVLAVPAMGRDGPQTYDRLGALWTEFIESAASEFLMSCSNPAQAASRLAQVASELKQAGESPNASWLFPAFAKVDPPFAMNLARHLIDYPKSSLTGFWTSLMERNSAVDQASRIGLLDLAAQVPDTETRLAVIAYVRNQMLSSDAPIEPKLREIVERMAISADGEIAFRLIGLVGTAVGFNLDWAWHLLTLAPLKDVAAEHPDALVESLVSRQGPLRMAPKEVIRHFIPKLVQAQSLDISRHAEIWDRLMQDFPRELYELMVARIERAASEEFDFRYVAIPGGYMQSLDLSELKHHPDYTAICRELWNRVAPANEHRRSDWIELFQAVIVRAGTEWIPGFLDRIRQAPTWHECDAWLAIIRFPGSMIVLIHPEVPRAVLGRWAELGEEASDIQKWFHLYTTMSSGSGPSLYDDSAVEYGYLEAAAIRAAQTHASDPELGPFFRFVAKMERDRRASRHKQPKG